MLYPVNKYLSLELIEEDKTDTGVLIPDGVQINKANFKVARIVQPAEGSQFLKGMRIVVPSHMVEEISFFGKTYYLVLESHVIGYLEQL